MPTRGEDDPGGTGRGSMFPPSARGVLSCLHACLLSGAPLSPRPLLLGGPEMAAVARPERRRKGRCTRWCTPLSNRSTSPGVGGGNASKRTPSSPGTKTPSGTGVGSLSPEASSGGFETRRLQFRAPRRSEPCPQVKRQLESPSGTQTVLVGPNPERWTHGVEAQPVGPHLGRGAVGGGPTNPEPARWWGENLLDQVLIPE